MINRMSFRSVTYRLFLATALLAGMLMTGVMPSQAAAAPAKAKWTVMVYISGDNDLQSYVISDIETELAPTGSTKEIQVVALADRGPGASTGPDDWKTTEYFHILPGMKATLANADATWDAGHAAELDMADPQTLLDFVSYSKAAYP